MKPWNIWSKPGTLNVNTIIQDMQTSSKIFFLLGDKGKNGIEIDRNESQ